MQLETLYVTDRKEWREWLRNNFKNKPEIWLVYPHKSTGKAVIEYNTAVEEALCFGWIDSIRRSMDKDHSIQKFSIRNEKSSYSQPNKERLKWLLERDLVHPTIKEEAKRITEEEFIYPEDILKELEKDKETWDNFQKLSESYKRIRIAFIDAARKRDEIFKQRLNNFIKYTKANKLIKGFGGIEKYY